MAGFLRSEIDRSNRLEVLDRRENQKPHCHDSAAKCETDPLLVVQVPVCEAIQRGACRCGDEDNEQGQDEDQVVQYQVAVA